MKRTITLMAAFVFLCGLSSPAIRISVAQQPRQEGPVRLKAELIELDVVVTDKNNRPVTDLKKEDFVLLDDKKPQAISFFSLVRATSVTAPGDLDVRPAPATTSGAMNPEPGRFIFIILDQYHITPANFPRLRDSLLSFINEDIGPNDQVAIIGTGSGLAVFQQVTKNKRALSLAINAFLSAGNDYQSVMAVDAGLADAQQGIGIPGSTAAALHGEYIARATLRTLQSIAKGIGDVPGRKIAVFVSEDLPILLDGSGTTNLAYELEQVVGKAQRGGLTFYSLDPRGLVTTIPGGSAAEARGGSVLGGGGSAREDPGASGDRLLSSRWGMMELAAATGGFSIFNTNNALKGLQEVLAQNEAYYVLGFYPDTSGRDGKFRRVKIQIKDRADLTVRARKGYIASSEKPATDKPESKDTRINKSLNSLVPVRIVRAAISQASAVRDPQTGERIAKVTVQIDARTWPFREEGGNHVGSVEVVGYAYDLKNTLVDGFSKTINMKIRPEVYARVLTEGINLPAEIKLKKAGLYNIRVVVINNETGEMGSASEWVEAH